MLLANAFLPAAAWYFLLYLWFVFALAARKNELQKEDEVPRSIISPMYINDSPNKTFYTLRHH